MKAILAFVILLSAGVASAQVKTCTGAWSVISQQQNEFLQITIQELKIQGPACDLVVQNADYSPALGQISLGIAPAQFCPVDAIANRKAYFSWKLPQELRATGTLTVLINGEKQGVLSLNEQDANFKGSCQ